MIGGIAEKYHAHLVLIGELETHDLGPELRGTLEVAARIDDMADLFDIDGRLL
jgi:hypothetical protein